MDYETAVRVQELEERANSLMEFFDSRGISILDSLTIMGVVLTDLFNTDGEFRLIGRRWIDKLEKTISGD